MALYQVYEWVSITQYLQNIRDFLEANNWTIDYYAEGSRIHVHKGSAHFDGTASTNNSGMIIWYGCTGYNSSAGSSGQPNVSGAIYWHSIGKNTKQVFVSTKNAFYVRAYHSSNGYNSPLWEGFGFIDDSDKIGVWDGGMFAYGSNLASHDCLFGSSGATYSSFYIAGSWTNPDTYSYGTGKVYGNMSEHYLSYDPAPYHSGIVPVPVLLWKVDSSNSSLLTPIAYAPGILKSGKGTIYAELDVIEISGEQYIWGVQSSCGDFLIKLEN